MDTMKTIPLTKGMFVKVDDQDYEKYAVERWYAHSVRPGRFYAARKGKTYMRYMHRDIAEAPAGVYVDHINGDGLDNRRENLRLCNNQQNNLNKKKNSNNTSGHKNIYWSKKERRWKVVVTLGGREIYGGYKKTMEEAVRSRDALVDKLCGDFSPTGLAGWE